MPTGLFIGSSDITPPSPACPGAYYHVTLRGNHRKKIFFRPVDRRRLDEIMSEALEHTQTHLRAYCWMMSNHVHLLVQVADRPLSALMQRVGTRFARLILATRSKPGSPPRSVSVCSMLIRSWPVNTIDDSFWNASALQATRRFTPDTRTNRAYSAMINFLHDFIFHPAYLALPSHSTNLPVPYALNSTSSSNKFSASQAHTLSKARGLIAAHALDARIASLSDVARFLNRSASALSRAAEAYRE